MKKDGLLYSCHKWCGLALFSLLLLQSSTGALIGFKSELVGLAYGRYGDAAVSGAGDRVQRILQWQATSHPDLAVSRLTFYDDVVAARLLEHPGDPLPRLALFDRRSGELIREGPLAAFPLELAALLHYSLVGGDTGAFVVGLEGLCLVFMVATGLLVWWPAKGHIKRALTIRWNTGARALWPQLHKVLGAYFAVFLLITGVTGAAMIFEDALKPLVNLFAEVEEYAVPALSPPQADTVPISHEKAIAQAESQLPGERMRQLRFVDSDHRALLFIFSNRQGAVSDAYNFIVVDRLAGNVAAVMKADGAATGERFFQYLLPLHTGKIAGVTGRVLMMINGLALLVIAATAVVIWLNGHRRRRQAARSASARHPPSRINPAAAPAEHDAGA